MNDQPCNEDSVPNSDLTTNDESDSTQSVDPKRITNSSSHSQTPETLIAVHSVEFQGPLPSPSMLEEFDRVVPGLARKIVDRSELEMQHRHKMEKQALNAQIEDRRAHRNSEGRGQLMAFVIVLIVFGTGIYLILNGYPRIGGTLVTSTVVILAGAFLAGRLPKTQKTNQEESKS